MSIREEEELFFQELRRKNPDIIADGMVDEAEFLAARYRIVYVLKEANGGKSWDLRAFIRDGGRPQTWDNIARWTEGILSWEQEFLWSEMEQNTGRRRETELKKIAAVNLKKTSGGYTSDGKEIRRAAVNERAAIKRQIEIYDPDFIICCGTGKAFADIFKGDDVAWQMTSRGVWYFKKGRTAVVAFSHPEARVSDAFLFYALTDAVREICSGGFCPA